MLFDKRYEESLFESEILSEECQEFTEAFLEESYDEIDEVVPVLEVVALYEIVSKISALENGILEEEIEVYSSHESLDDYIVDLLEFYEVEDVDVVLETAQEVLSEVAGSPFDVSGKNQPPAVIEVAKKKPFRERKIGFVDRYITGKSAKKDLEKLNKRFTKVQGIPTTNANFGKKLSTFNRIGDLKKDTQAAYDRTLFGRSKRGGRWVKNNKVKAGLGALTGAGVLGGTGYAVNRARRSPVVAPEPTGVYDRLKNMGERSKQAIMNNKSLALKALGGTAAAGGLGYLAYKLWKNKKNKENER
jgi:hypothetical protein